MSEDDLVISSREVSQADRKAYPWMGPILWSAYPMYRGVYAMAVGATREEAIANIKPERTAA